MRIRRISTLTVAVAVLVGRLPAMVGAEEIWTVTQGNTILSLNTGVLDQLGLEVSAPSSHGAARSRSALSFPIHPASTLTFSIEDGSLTDFLGGEVVHDGDLRFVGKRAPLVIEALQVSMVRGLDKAQWVVSGPTGELGGLVLQRMKAGFNPATRTMTFHCPAVFLSAPLAVAMGDAALAGRSVGSLTIEASAEWLGGEEPSAEPVAPMRGGGGSRMSGCDMSFCQLYGLYMPGGARLGDIVGLAAGTTSWNLGDMDCMWFPMPNGEEHPFIVMDLFRLKTVDGSERFEQIGQSWIKHGFYALGDIQCGGTCTYEPGSGHSAGTWLGQGCTDTYTPGLNAGQNGMGPRYEVDPWTGEWTHAGSHNSQGYHGHDGIEHRLQVYDQDLDPAQNPGATYYNSSFYVMLDDVNAMNSAAWKEVTINSGAPGGSWSFGMSGAGVMPEIGHPVEAWTGAHHVVIAEEFPLVEFQSPDGRAVLLAKATDLGAGTWHYEYALMNIDVDRKIGSFNIPIMSSTIVTNIGFHAVHHHDEDVAGYSNDPWSAVVSSDAITWSTVDNPIRWGVLYNFRFDANQPPNPEDVLVTLGLFDPGTPQELTGLTIVPEQVPPDCNTNGIPDNCDVDCGPPGGECDVPGCGGSQDCNSNGIPDECESNDCNSNGTPDDCDVAPGGGSLDCNLNGIPDECDLDPLDPDGNGEVSEDCQPNGTPDECDPDGDADGVPDDCDNCPDDYNPGQEDEDGDGIGNACDPDYCDGIVLGEHFNLKLTDSMPP